MLSRDEGQAFWDAHPWLRGTTPVDHKWHLPLVLFDDAGPFSNTKSTYARQFYSLLGTGSEKESRILIATGVVNKSEEDKSWPIVLDSFSKLAHNKEPGSWGGILLFLGADLEYACNVVGLRHFNSAGEMCSLCLANSSDYPFNDLMGNAAYKATLVDNETFLNRLRHPLHPLAGHAIFNKWTYRHDNLHNLDHHGLAGHVIANILYKHVSGERDAEVLPGENVDERLAFLNADIRAYYTAAKVENRLPPLKMDNLKNGPWPVLKGQNVKAANTRALVPYVLQLQQRAVDLNPNDTNKHMLKVVHSLQCMYDVMYNNGYFLDPNALATLRDAVARFGRHYYWLAATSFRQELTRWHIVPKFHYVVGHMGEQTSLINPRFVQSYGSESMVGAVTKTYGKSQSGPFHNVIQRTVVLKYKTGMKFLWELR